MKQYRLAHNWTIRKYDFLEHKGLMAYQFILWNVPDNPYNTHCLLYHEPTKELINRHFDYV